MCPRGTRFIVLCAALVAAILIAPTARAGEFGTVSGRLVDSLTGQPIAFAFVTLVELNLQTITDADGRFTLSGVPVGSYTVMVTPGDGRLAWTVPVSVTADKVTQLALRAKRQALPKPEDAAQIQMQAPSAGEARAPMAAARPYGADAALSLNNLNAARAYCLPVPLYSDFNTEEYARIEENRFLDVVGNPLSTFSIDVDGASYANVRRFLNRGQLPPPDAVRIEELVNYFPYDYPRPDGDVPLAITTHVGVCPWNRPHRLVQIGLKGRELECGTLPPNNLVFLIDVSGSMQSADKLPLLKSAFRLLVQQLREEDRVAIVVYAGAAGLVLPSTSGFDRSRILCAIDRLQAGGSTAGAAGIQLAYRAAREHFVQGGNNRIILATDGDFNVGVSSTSELLRMIERERESGIYLSVLGFGTGNLKDGRMEQLADKGNGNYNYIDNLREGQKVLVDQMGGTLVTIAKDVKIQVEFNPARVKSYRLVGYENRRLAKEDFNDDTKDAGELGLGHTVTALYEIVPADGETVTSDVDPLKYQSQGIRPEAMQNRELLTVKFRYKDPAGGPSRLLTRTLVDDGDGAPESADLRFATAVAEFGMLLSQSEFRGDANWDQVLALASGAMGSDRGGYRHEFLEQVRVAQSLSGSIAER